MSINSDKEYIGIYSGISNTVVSFFNNTSFEQVEFKGSKIIPSALYFQSMNDTVFGSDALKKGIFDPVHLVTDFKRDLGTDKKYEYEFEKDTIILTPKQVSVMFLKYLKDESEKYINSQVDYAVITVPANFTQTQVELTREAGLEAGFVDVRIQKEAEAIGLSYALDEEDDKIILVYDFGGRTFNATLLKASASKLEVLGVNGNPKLGGDDITNVVVELINEHIEDEYDLSMFELDESGLPEADFVSNTFIIKKNAEEAKIELSSYESTKISIPNLVSSNDSTISIEFEQTRSAFEDEIIDIRKQSLDVVKELISSSNLEAKDIDIIVMIGGSSNIPSIYNSIKDTLGKDPSINKDTALVISEGAVIEARRWDKVDDVQEGVIDDETLFGISVKNYLFNILKKLKKMVIKS